MDNKIWYYKENLTKFLLSLLSQKCQIDNFSAPKL